ncbi:hypothetical protein [Flavobacterium sp. LB1P62]|uniref:hypothetical protein n=1 Tax=Flavobacterium sp. LB1P62 TaxID=3401715 RepID=UPI003AABD2AD
MCKWFKIDYFVINDWDFDELDLDISTISEFIDIQTLKYHKIYCESTNKAMITNNWNLINSAGINKIHFNVKKLESVIGYHLNDKSSLGIWNLLNSDAFSVSEGLFPENLSNYLGITTI